MKDQSNPWMFFRSLLFASMEGRLPKIRRKDSLFTAGSLFGSPA